MPAIAQTYHTEALASTTEWWQVNSTRTVDYFLVYGLLTFFLVSLTGIMLVDMHRKSRTGELQETGWNLLWILYFFAKLPCLLFRRTTWAAFADLFRTEESKSERNTVVVAAVRESQAVIDRLSTAGPTISAEKNKGGVEVTEVKTVEVFPRTTTVEIFAKATTVEMCPKATQIDILPKLTAVGKLEVPETKEKEAASEEEGQRRSDSSESRSRSSTV